jgi:radical SAM protein with 4Fe4S-binding SPASM domain
MKAMPIFNFVVPCAYNDLSESEGPLATPKIRYRLHDGVVLRVSETEGLVMPPQGNKGNMNDPLSVDRALLDVLRKQIFEFPGIPEKSLKLLLETETIIPYDGRDPAGIKTFYAENPEFPHYLLFEITMKCQCGCKMCFQTDLRNSGTIPPDPPIETIKKRLKKMKDYGIFWVEIFGGEPLLRPDLPQILDYAKELGLEITLSSNGEYLTEDFLPNLQGIRKTRISIDALGKVHDDSRQCTGLFDKAIAALDLLYRNGYPVFVTATVSSENVQGLPLLLHFLTDNYPLLPVGVRKAKVRPDQGLGPVDIYNIKQIFIHKPFVSIAGLEGKRLGKIEPARFYGCTTPNCYVYLRTDGKILPCRTDYNTKLTKDFEDYHSSTELLNDLTEGVLKTAKVLPACNEKDCHFLDRCVGPCRFTRKYQQMMQNI